MNMRLKNCFPVYLLIFLMTASCVVQENPVTGNKRAFAYSWDQEVQIGGEADQEIAAEFGIYEDSEDRKSTRLNSSHVAISYAVFCLKKKTLQTTEHKRSVP